VLPPIVAETVKLRVGRGVKCFPCAILAGLEGAYIARRRQESKLMIAFDTFDVFKENEAAASVTMKGFQVFSEAARSLNVTEQDQD
jgi:hypothetical protein